MTIHLDPAERLSENFTRAELQCKCGCGEIPPEEFIAHLQALREAAGFAIPINSGFRCPEYNAQVSGTGRDGPHTKGAIDAGVTGARALTLIGLALARGWTGIGVKQHGPYLGRFIHLDRLPNAEGQPRPHCWTYP